MTTTYLSADPAVGRAICAAYEAATGGHLPTSAADLVCRLVVDVPDLGQRAYIAATAGWETAGTFRAIHERYNGPSAEAYFEAKYGVPTTLAHRLGNMHPGDGYRYHGRGYVQLTGRANYRRMSDALARYAGMIVDLEEEPDLALAPDIAYHVLVLGMTRGLFTGAALSRYISGGRRDYAAARAVVNGNDKAEQIAALARSWETAMTVSGR